MNSTHFMTRPPVLSPYFSPLTDLPGVGKQLAAALDKLVGTRVFDLLAHLPIAAADRRKISTVDALQQGTIATVTGRVTEHIIPQRKGTPTRVLLEDQNGDTLTLVFFKMWGSTLEKKFPIGADLAVSGKIEFYQSYPQMVHPDQIVPAERVAEIARIDPIYPLTAGVSQRVLIRAVHAALDTLPTLPEWHEPALIKREHWPDMAEALTTCHLLEDLRTLDPQHPNRTRLAYDEALAMQLMLALLRAQERSLSGVARHDKHNLMQAALTALPYEMTNSQKDAIAAITTDLASPQRMIRLLQGDVGSGKTAVAFAACAYVIGSGAQAAIMAPTEILARQHFEGLMPFCDQIGVRIALLTGKDKAKTRQATLMSLQSGDIDLIIGTHALFQDSVVMQRLGFIVIDEQHRFGVNQRLTLSQKGHGVDILVMTATPIPRTLTLTLYGDMDVTRLTEKPPGREPVTTRVLPDSKLGELVAALKRKLSTGKRIYWVCPLVSESEVLDLTAVEERAQQLAQYFHNQVGLVHGQLKPEEKQAVMDAFKRGEIQILVATTVIEVGVDVPEATVIVIDHAERFGLAQLHQLRGRVGRGGRKGTCLLIYGTNMPLSETARQRLEIMRATDDGFVIAEKDLSLRGGGDLLGTKQSGLPAFKFCDLGAHQGLLEMARDDARLTIQKDPDLSTDRGQALRLLLHLYQMDQAMSTLEAG